MSANKFIRTSLLVRSALLATLLALGACSGVSQRPATQTGNCGGVLEEPYMVCDAPVG
ncbi:hypothetical protein [Rudaea sp.]|uniref:hypothetical protein n=1 Tax=Rudaea sp. TaxID=2136325 RepID=UPI003220432F